MDGLIRIHLDDQMDSKTLLGSYVCTDTPGEFVWKEGALTQAVQQGRWIVIEDIDLAPFDVLAAIIPLLESNRLYLPARDSSIVAHAGFRLFGTRTVGKLARKESAAVQMIQSLTTQVFVEAWKDEEVREVVGVLFPSLLDAGLVEPIVEVHRLMTSARAETVIDGVRVRRQLTVRDLLKFCRRCLVLKEAVDCFCNMINSEADRVTIAKRLGLILHLHEQKVEFMLEKSLPEVNIQKDHLQVGRVFLDVDSNFLSTSIELDRENFCRTRRTLQAMEAIAACVYHNEPVLLTGETGTGKTTIVQYVASQVGTKLAVVNLSQQTDSGDLLGGFKPIDVRCLAQSLLDELLELLPRVTSKSKNSSFLQACKNRFEAKNWKGMVKLLKQATQLTLSKRMRRRWDVFAESVAEFERKVESTQGKFAFTFVDGILVKALKEGFWLLLDEVNLAPAETLERLSGLLEGEQGSLSLTEKGEVEEVKRHPNFRLFACMNPPTDVGKKDLPMTMKARFTEIFVDEIENEAELREVVQTYLGKTVSVAHVNSVVNFYLNARAMAKSNEIYDGANQPVHFNLRSLSRTLNYVKFMQAQGYSLDRSLFEGACMVFSTQLHPSCQQLMETCIVKHLCKAGAKASSSSSSLSNDDGYTCIGSCTINQQVLAGFWIKKGPHFGQLPIPTFILTPSCQLNVRNIARAAAPYRYPILLQGPTSAGKTSMIEFLAASAGHKFVRINNHAHTDVQEYVGGYTTDEEGKLVFQEGPLMLNRLLDDNRELLIPETQELVKPHANFLLFATQNPAGGVYGGRKMLSRAFRNRFLEVHVDEIPHAELVEMMEKRCKIAKSRAQKIVEVMKELHRRRQRSNVFAGGLAFVTPRDLFKWADRMVLADNDNYDVLAQEGYMLLAEGQRKEEDKKCVREVVEQTMKQKINVERLYDMSNDLIHDQLFSGLVKTRNAKRMLRLMARCMRFREPILLVGETGTGKTSVCQAFAAALSSKLHILNCHQSTEASDLIGGFRPIRGKESSCRALFLWYDGPLVTAMREGHLLLIDEISLTDDSVLERLNSVLEPGRTITLAEKGGEVIEAHRDFLVFATMNPGGDFGKKELSPALRNRFTEIWVDAISELEDLRCILSLRMREELQRAGYGEKLLLFWQWFSSKNKVTLRRMLSLRDLLAWVEFMNISKDNGLSMQEGFLHGACLVLLDGLGIGDGSSEASARSLKEESLQYLHAMLSDSSTSPVLQASLSSSAFFSSPPASVVLTQEKFGIQPFFIPRGPAESPSSFAMTAPTTCQNLMRVLRGMQLRKPILLEGSPGVGKTSLVQALAAVSGHKLVRINLSDQTDMMDLLGSDLPVGGGGEGAGEGGGESSHFAWCDGVFLQALKAGDWVLLDELNLASQSVLEGLNAVLDHRGEVFLPELGRSFFCPPSFRIFAAQNPLQQGGGRKGLPKSFLNRFTTVRVEELTADDLLFIAQASFPQIDEPLLRGMIAMNAEVQVATSSTFASSGRPWEFNLRDIFRWCELMVQYQEEGAYRPQDFVPFLFSLRLRTSSDREQLQVIARRHFDDLPSPLLHVPHRASAPLLQVGKVSMLRSKKPDVLLDDAPPLLLPGHLQALEGLMMCVEMGWMGIVIGPSAAGKTSLVRSLAASSGNKLREMAMTSDTDTTDLLGCFEQLEQHKRRRTFLSSLHAWTDDLFRYILALMKEDETLLPPMKDQLLLLQHNLAGLRQHKNSSASFSAGFEWIDGILVKAMERGEWLLLDNVNLCNANVLDRLNPLLEPQGVLLLNERGLVDGEVRIVRPHPNFRLFLSMDAHRGEISRAMRNRGVEICLLE
ncbi:hypothetical protein GUITHDRAFT_77201, partial [Guillardia theta CCMP2712]